jgi:rRNA maturation endonuclease Nob1
MNDKVYPPTHQGGGIAFCSKCEKSFVDNNYYEFCPRCGCRIRIININIREEQHGNKN